MSVADTKAIEQTLEGIRRRQIISLGFLFTAIAVLTALAWQSVTGMVSIWLNDSAYNHGLFILPIAAFMAWERRERLAGLTLEPYWPGIILVAGFAFAWLFARGAAIMEGEQIAYVGMLQGLMLTVLGRRIFRAQLLPILYLWLLVPTGGFLLPALQGVATWLTTQFLQLTSIPFFVEQFYFQLPVGLFFVAPGCAGLNFILAALALSIVYADLMYVGWQRKIICILSWLGVAVLANGIRIFGILWLAEITNKQLAIVDDHLLYGWGFFFIILIGLMYAGRRFSNMPPVSANDGVRDWLPTAAASIGSIGAATALSILIISAVVGYGLVVFSDGVRPQGLVLGAPENTGEWRMAGELGYAQSAFPNADARNVWRFENAGTELNLFVAYYAGQWDGHEAAADNNNIFGDADIKIIGRASPVILLNGAPVQVQEETVSGARNNLLIWRWYCAGGHFTTSRLEVRLRASAGRLLLRDSQAAVFTLFAPDSSGAREKMTSLMQAIATAKPGFRVADAQGNTVNSAGCR